MPISLMTYWRPSSLDFTRTAFPKEPSPIFFTFSYLSMLTQWLDPHAASARGGAERVICLIIAQTSTVGVETNDGIFKKGNDLNPRGVTWLHLCNLGRCQGGCDGCDAQACMQHRWVQRSYVYRYNARGWAKTTQRWKRNKCFGMACLTSSIHVIQVAAVSKS